MSTAPQDQNRLTVELLQALQSNPCAINDELADHYLKRTGFICPDIRVKRLMALATQKFLTDVLADSYQVARLRQASRDRKVAAAAGGSSKPTKVVLTTQDLTLALADSGVHLCKPEYFADK
ncbi:putative transcription initiation factor IID; TAF10 subunit [Paratrimastix pyriformis]|uniref:Transcription initiation factor IID n=1 Tax=Paratrimastix pyriformis TaxID=342808 RepID=A0ABQ8UGI3_9EUKA|nr:putative transcription initiation factor IID; TAF10 subunit [Paratrimastix pyriformis]